MTNKQEVEIVKATLGCVTLLLCGFLIQYILDVTLYIDIPWYADLLLGLTLVDFIWRLSFSVWILTFFLEVPML